MPNDAAVKAFLTARESLILFDYSSNQPPEKKKPQRVWLALI